MLTPKQTVEFASQLTNVLLQLDGIHWLPVIKQIEAAATAPLLERIADLERHTARLETLCQSGANAKTQVSALSARLARQQEQLVALTAELTHHRQVRQPRVPPRFLQQD